VAILVKKLAYKVSTHHQYILIVTRKICDITFLPASCEIMMHFCMTAKHTKFKLVVSI